MQVLHDWLLTAERVAVHVPTRTAVIADLHLGYAEARRRRGEAVPRECIFDILEPLEQVRQQHAAKRLIVAGDLLEDGACREALKAFLDWLDQRKIDLIALVPGNHDLGLTLSASAASRLPLYPQGVTLGDWCIVHGEGRLPDGPVVHGHDHPCVRWSPRGRVIRPRFFRDRSAHSVIDAPCYLSGPDRLILPAFSKEAAGVNVLSVRRWGTLHCQAVADDRVLDLGEVSSLRRRLSRSGRK
jgi:putative SbcD/Mre11-related phosphoesterase